MTIMNLHAKVMRRFIFVVAIVLSTVMTAMCGMLVGAGIGTAGGAVYDIAH